MTIQKGVFMMRWKVEKVAVSTHDPIVTKIAHGFMQLDVNLIADYESGENILSTAHQLLFASLLPLSTPKKKKSPPKENHHLLLHVFYNNPNCITWASVCVCVCVYQKLPSFCCSVMVIGYCKISLCWLAIISFHCSSWWKAKSRSMWNM